MVEPILPAGAPPRDRRPLLGYGMVFLASTLFAVNGAVSKVIQEAGLSSARLTQVRSTGAFVGFALILLLTNRRTLRLRAREVPLLVVFGICGLAFVQWFYRSEEHTSELQSRSDLVCRLLLEKKKN